jgi:hypothetical protein
MFPIDIAAMVAAAALVFGGGSAALLSRRPKPDAEKPAAEAGSYPEKTEDTSAK